MANTFQTIVLESEQTTASFLSNCNLAPLQIPALVAFENYIGGIVGGNYPAKVTFYTGSARATATITVSTGGSANNETITICGVTFTAKTSGAAGNQFNISATAATQAASMVLFINASTSLTNIVTAANVLGVVTLSAVLPGAMGNGLVAANVDLANVVVSSFATVDKGLTGTTFVSNLI